MRKFRTIAAGMTVATLLSLAAAVPASAAAAPQAPKSASDTANGYVHLGVHGSFRAGLGLEYDIGRKHVRRYMSGSPGDTLYVNIPGNATNVSMDIAADKGAAQKVLVRAFWGSEQRNPHLCLSTHGTFERPSVTRDPC